MLTIALDLAVIAIVVFCGWRGYKNGLIRGAFGVAALVVSLLIASIAATAYSEEFTDILSPFVGGIIDSALVEKTEDDEAANGSATNNSTASGSATNGVRANGSAASGSGVNTPATDNAKADSSNADNAKAEAPKEKIDLTGYEDKSDGFKTAYSALRRIGLSDSPAAHLAGLTAGDEEDGAPALLLSDVIADKLSSTLAYAAVFGIAFILLAIIFTVIGNLVGFVFSLPGLRLVDIIAGAAFGLLKGLIIVYAIAAVLRYAGLVSPATINGTSILKSIINNNPIANSIGI